MPFHERLLLPLGVAIGATLLASLSHTERGSADAAAVTAATAAPDIPAIVDVIDRTTVLLEGDGIYGSGILIDPALGRVLTANHVVDEMTSPVATSYTGRKGRAKVIARDKDLDVALLDVPDLADASIPTPVLGDASKLRPGQEIYAIGSPRKLAFTVSRGIVSYADRQVDGKRWLQIDMAINDGNSGGPVFTARGEIVGVMSFILRRSQGLAFALPITTAIDRLDK